MSSIRLNLPHWLDARIEAAPPCLDDEAMMALATELARENVRRGDGGPFGAVLFDPAGKAIAAGVNRVVPEHCSLAHAETLAYMLGQSRLGRARINGDGGRYTLATSAQPCCQCFGATVWAGIDVLLIGARAEDVMRLTEFDEGPLPADWVGELARRGIEVRRDLQREEACAVLSAYNAAGGPRY